MTLDKNNWNKLSEEEARVILHKGTELPFSGEFDEKDDFGSYVCRQCEAPLFRSYDKFFAGCGWPSFDMAVENAIREIPDRDGERVEIICNNCEGHLGHVFRGEQYTVADTRYCVNSISLIFTED